MNLSCGRSEQKMKDSQNKQRPFIVPGAKVLSHISTKTLDRDSKERFIYVRTHTKITFKVIPKWTFQIHTSEMIIR